jgi:hypothetical protein
MASRKSSKRLKFSDVVPVWTSKNVDTNAVLVQATLLGFGIYDIGSYWRKLRVAIILCILMGMLIGGAAKGFGGVCIGSVLGFATPAAAIALFVTVLHIVIYLSIFCLVWAAILFALWLFLAALVGR